MGTLSDCSQRCEPKVQHQRHNGSMFSIGADLVASNLIQRWISLYCLLLFILSSLLSPASSNNLSWKTPARACQHPLFLLSSFFQPSAMAHFGFPPPDLQGICWWDFSEHLLGVWIPRALKPPCRQPQRVAASLSSPNCSSGCSLFFFFNRASFCSLQCTTVKHPALFQPHSIPSSLISEAFRAGCEQSPVSLLSFSKKKGFL